MWWRRMSVSQRCSSWGRNAMSASAHTSRVGRSARVVIRWRSRSVSNVRAAVMSLGKIAVGVLRSGSAGAGGSGHLGCGRGPATVSGRDHDIDEQVEPPNQQAADRAAHEVGEHLEVQIAVDRPRPRVTQHQAGESLGCAEGGSEPDGSTPVLRDQRHVIQVELLDYAGDDACVLAGMVRVICCRGGQSKPGIVQSDASERVAQGHDHLPIHERPRRIAVQHQQHRAGSLVDVVHHVPADREEPALEREQFVIDPTGPHTCSC